MNGFKRQCPPLSLEMELYESLEKILSYEETGEPWAGVCVSERQSRAERDILSIQRLLHEYFLVLAKSDFPAFPSPYAGPSPRGLCIQSDCSVLPYAPPTESSCFLMRSRNFRFAFSLRITLCTCLSTLPLNPLTIPL